MEVYFIMLHTCTTHTHAHKHACTIPHAHTHMHTHTCECTCARFAHLYNTHVHTLQIIYKCHTLVHTPSHTHTHSYTNTHTHTHTHTHQAQHTQTHTLTLLFSSRNTRCWLLMPISCLATDLYVPPSRWYPDVEEGTVVPWTLLALLYVAMLGIPLRELLKFSHLGTDPLGDVLGFGVHCRESLARLRVFLLLLANEELPLVATGDKASPESCRTVCEVAMIGGGEEEEWKEGGGE